jgi:HK97 family phage prohead protease
VTDIFVSDIDGTMMDTNGDPIASTVGYLTAIDTPIVIVTGRKESERDATANQLADAGIDYAMLMTNNGDQSTVDYKAATMKALQATYNVVGALDNDPAVRDAYANLGVEVKDPADIPTAGPDSLTRDIIEMDADEAQEDALEAAEAPESLCELLAEQLGDVVTFRFVAHGYHWNVKGELFSQYHELFADIYGVAEAAIDPLAENILKLGYDAPVGLAALMSVRELADPAGVPDTPVAMATSLLDMNDDVIDGYQECIAQAIVENQQGVVNFLAAQLDEHQKISWQLRSSIGAQTQTTMMPSGAIEDDAPVRSKVTRLSPRREYLSEKRETIEGVERRSLDVANIEVRDAASSDSAGSFSGYAAVWDSPSLPLPFTETIKRGAFSRTLKSRNQVFLLANHDPGRVLAARRSGTLRLEEDATGLRVEADLPNTSDGRDLAVLLRRGDVSSMSFGFSVPAGGDHWSDENNRELRDVRLHEVSVVSSPAYESTSAAVRDLSNLASVVEADASLLEAAFAALERGDTLTSDQASILEGAIVKLRDAEVDVPASIVMLKNRLDLAYNAI